MVDLQLIWSYVYLYSPFVCPCVGGEGILCSLVPNSHVMFCHLALNLEKIILFRVGQVVIRGLNGHIKGLWNEMGVGEMLPFNLLSPLLKFKTKCILRFKKSLRKTLQSTLFPVILKVYMQHGFRSFYYIKSMLFLSFWILTAFIFSV